MKRLLLCVIIVAIFLGGCTPKEKAQETRAATKDRFVKGIWITYSEINALLKSEDFETTLEGVTGNLKVMGITDLFLHVRANCDSFYKSQYFPLMAAVRDKDFDPLELIIEACHRQDIRVHGWINPYRVLSGTVDINALSQESPAYRWLKDEDSSNDNNVCFANGIYLNPSSSQVRKLIIDGVREAVLKYDLDGIHFDDYFYPTTAEEFDRQSYEEYYKENEAFLDLASWRRANVNALISGCYTALKFINKDLIFSVSPSASIERNLESYYADVEEWIKNGCVDWIMPQLYFGFLYPDQAFRFEELLARWKGINSNKQVRLIIGLAAYKVGIQTEPDKEEWNGYDDILLRQTEICRQDEAVSGYVFFSYSSLFSSNPPNTRAREQLLKK